MKTSVTVVIIIALIIIVAFIPLFIISDAEFGGTDDAAGDVVEDILQREYTPWLEPVIEKMIGAELPGETETLLFCIQTGIGVAVIAFSFGYLAARKKYAS